MTLLSKMSDRKTSDDVIRKRDPHSKHELFATIKKSRLCKLKIQGSRLAA